MTQRTPSYLKGQFETADVPTSADFGDGFDSFINLADSTTQTIQGNLTILGNIIVANVTASAFVGNQVDVDTVSANAVFTSGLRFTVDSSINAAGTTRTGAYALTKTYNVVKIVTAAVNDGVRLTRSATPGRQFVVWNRSATALNVYPSSSDVAIDGISAGAAFIVSVNEQYSFTNVNATQFLSGR